MRIVGGSHRGRPLIAPPDRTTRPTTDRVREALFNMLLHSPNLLTDESKTRLDGGIVLDPFAGSGPPAFNATSRGRPQSQPVELAPAARRADLPTAGACYE